ncbi:MAG: repressor LexA [Candidatus Portnoybacteria bacterium RIFCSPLOWO2_12_FULL_39_9]|uniref:Repressor LexA n=1 Tax=Candidatus Portnoybacteria bacterium RIFCSPHIGHO2_12_FULL_38_9 TaxID=1801997 RepID=A0A1G2FFP6_9BACT|nr:MAG: repressor LexA [Candidatus Portnoybacteria bacterium RBG_13_40_8]OGZ36371.1 MAG: repressor LexA [Candidatus Portnoybacteria bacterium RIFCSPHIGHO2_12_FULL_38_9]OGZ36819.1 MAG: repressor LexA [Candidatus Portnoybacteria bacterium RIFCSPHIGHO2_02_FULL_39_12]OGZ37760.1 MAG: repressor LexA [Candidatus Portnoybacteria bacterium RIFCSPLOWO2_01_FULL_38_39]OGZ40171.1 MAG: repressor LexA [Candidatus Portnoybacteria bacterium RIFCSPLOWO2_12_FULL_39_9]
MGKGTITKRQKELLSIIYNYIKNSGYPPTFEEMKEDLNVSSNQSIIDLLVKLEKQDFIKRNESSARSINILPLGYKVLNKLPLIPFLGATSAGAPIEAIEISGEWQSVSSEVARLKDEVFLLKISGDSMINAGIDDGDMVLVKSQKEFFSGDVVLANVKDESTVKRFISDDNPPYVYLKPENPDPKHKVILFEDGMRLVGKVISVFKNGQWKSVK